jgi:hypothetical protein
MVPSYVLLLSVVRQGMPVIIDVVPGFGVSFGAADVGSTSSLVIWQISPVSIPTSLVVASLSQAEALASQAVESVSSAMATFLESPLCREREDSFPMEMDPVLSLASVEAHSRTIRNPSPATGLIRRGFLV